MAGSWAQGLGGQGGTASRSSGGGDRGVRLASAVRAGGPAHLPLLTDGSFSPVPEAPVRTHQPALPEPWSSPARERGRSADL